MERRALEVLGRIGARAMNAGNDRGDGNGGFIVLAGPGRIAEGPAIEPLHEDGIAMDIENSGGAVAFVPLEETRPPALFL